MRSALQWRLPAAFCVVVLAGAACSSERPEVGAPGERTGISGTDDDNTPPGGDDDGHTTNPGVPSAWICDPDYFGDDTCDCGCGAIDQDCAVLGSEGCANEGCYVDGCQYCYDPEEGDSMRCQVGGWTCSEYYYGDGSCDCGCGIMDVDCETGCTEPGCEELGCEYCSDGTSSTLCGEAAPDVPGWTCSPSYYGAGDGCDCGCGIIDPDCDGGGCAEPNCREAACNWCSDGTGGVGTCT